MKEFGKLFSRRYSAVCVNDDVACSQLQSMVTPGFGLGTRPDVDPAVVSAAQVALQRIQRRKSLTTNRSMKPIDILGSFFYEPSHGKRNRVPTRAFLLLAIGFLAIATATLVKVFDPYNLIFKWKLIMTEGGEIFNLWAQPPVDLYIKIYLFNITNAEAFLAGQEQLKVEQVGPYVYKEIMTHENVTFNTNNTMSSTPSHPLVWQAQLSGGYHEDDEVVMLNIAMLWMTSVQAAKRNSDRSEGQLPRAHKLASDQQPGRFLVAVTARGRPTLTTLRAAFGYPLHLDGCTRSRSHPLGGYHFHLIGAQRKIRIAQFPESCYITPNCNPAVLSKNGFKDTSRQHKVRTDSSNHCQGIHVRLPLRFGYSGKYFSSELDTF
ncbi:uncharacterized protein LOC108035858 isoform X4 [Drosophila biarmipes]|uniref:uncharacterized protein LOC108035858 isoform X4 n=1 Tax=Drosophila biarmipes TaxID=125945 RepID=UPI001CDB13B4|nr:uncharacterized protein LOC108035858 isoform X4 [Drosophila biarmipes]